MQTLSTPDGDLAARVLREVGFDERLEGYRLRERTGPMPETLYSFEEVVHLLGDQAPYVSPKRLEEWVRNVGGDDELAMALGDVIREETNDRDRLSRMGSLMAQRICQCKRAVEL